MYTCRTYLIAYNYSDNSSISTAIWVIALGEPLGLADLNVTSRITSFVDPVNNDKKVH